MPLWFAAAFAQEVAVQGAFTPRPIARHPVFDMRVGADTPPAVTETAAVARPFLCAEVTPIARFSVEACGTGSGFLHRDDAPEMAHFRARAAVLRARRGRLEGEAVAGLGFAELQVGEDAPGFRFGPATSADQVEGAGPEASVSAKGRVWFAPAAYAVVDANVGLAWIAAAPAILEGAEALVPFGALTIGAGF